MARSKECENCIFNMLPINARDYIIEGDDKEYICCVMYPGGTPIDEKPCKNYAITLKKEQ